MCVCLYVCLFVSVLKAYLARFLYTLVAFFYRYMYLRKGGRVKKNTCICGLKEAHAAYMQSAVTTTRSSAAASKCVPENKNVAKVCAEEKNK